MASEREKELWGKVAKAGGEAIDQKGYVTSVDILMGIGWLRRADHDAWRRGQVPYLEKAVSAKLSKISKAMKAFRRFSKSGNESVERNCATHYFLPSKFPLKSSLSQPRESKEAKPNEEVLFRELWEIEDSTF